MAVVLLWAVGVVGSVAVTVVRVGIQTLVGFRVVADVEVDAVNISPCSDDVTMSRAAVDTGLMFLIPPCHFSTYCGFTLSSSRIVSNICTS